MSPLLPAPHLEVPLLSNDSLLAIGIPLQDSAVASTHMLTLAPCTDKATWWGCGLHIPGVLDSVPEAERCGCEPKVEVDGVKYPPKASQP